MANKTAKSTKTTKTASTKSSTVKRTTPATKKAPTRATRSATTKTAPKETPVSETKIAKKRTPFRINRTYAIIGIAVLALAGLLYVFRGVFVAATVNGQPIPRLTVIRELERQGGKQTLNSLITKQLILQEAGKRNISVSEKEIDDEIKKIEDNFKKQGQKLDDVIQAQNITRESLREQIEVQKLIEKMLSKDIQVSDKEVTDYMTQNAESLPENTQATEIKEQLKQQKLNDKFQAWLGDLQQKARIRNFVTY